MSNLTVKGSFDFLNDSPEDKVSMGDNVVACIAVPAVAAKLINVPITVVQLTLLTTLLRADISLAASGDHSAIAKRVKSEAKWDDGYVSLVEFVNQIGKGDKAFILSCGLKATAEVTTPTPMPEALVNLIAKPTEKTGEIVFTNDAQKQAAAFLYGAFPVGTSVTVSGNTITIANGTFTCYLSPNTHHTATIQGLPSDIPFKVAGLAFNLKGTGPLTLTAKNVKPE